MFVCVLIESLRQELQPRAEDEGEDGDGEDDEEEVGRTRQTLGAVAPVIEVAEAPRRVVVEISGKVSKKVSKNVDLF